MVQPPFLVKSHILVHFWRGQISFSHLRTGDLELGSLEDQQIRLFLWGADGDFFFGPGNLGISAWKMVIFCRIWSVFLIFGFKATGFHGLKHDQQNGWFFQIPHWNPCYHGIWSIHLMNLAKCLAAFGVANFPPGWDALFKALNWWMPWGFQDVPSHKNGSLRCTDVASTSINHLTNHFNLEKNRPKRRCTQFS